MRAIRQCPLRVARGVRRPKGRGARDSPVMRSDLETIRVETPDAGLVVLTLDRPQVLNAINTKMAEELRDIFVPLRYAPGELRAIILTGSGERAFSAGADLKERKGMSDEAWRLQHTLIREIAAAVIDCPVPAIAAVNGGAYGGGCELALACDFIYAAEGARFALPEVTIGIMPGAGGTQTLARAVGERRAKELILTGRPWSAEEGQDWGVVNKVCAAEALMPAALETARRIADNAPISVRQAKTAIHRGLQSDLRTGLVLESEAYQRMIPTEDRREGIAAFNEKRKPRFLGR